VSVIGFSFFTHEEVKCGADRRYESICAVRWATWVVSISDIFGMFGSVYRFWINATSDEPLIDDSEVIVSISWITRMMIGSFPFWESDIPVVSSRVESGIMSICTEREARSILVVPGEPSTTNARNIDIRYIRDLRLMMRSSDDRRIHGSDWPLRRRFLRTSRSDRRTYLR
jgi:hypothetical protein